jgi:hypothetical protein
MGEKAWEAMYLSGRRSRKDSMAPAKSVVFFLRSRGTSSVKAYLAAPDRSSYVCGAHVSVSEDDPLCGKAGHSYILTTGLDLDKICRC